MRILDRILLANVFDSLPLTYCYFDHFATAHAPLAALALSTLVLVGVAWPIASTLYLAQRLVAPPVRGCAPPRCLVARCDGVQKAMPAGWVQVYDVEAKAVVFAHLESGARLGERPLGPDAWGAAVRVATARSSAKRKAERAAESKVEGSAQPTAEERKGEESERGKGASVNDNDADRASANTAGSVDGDGDAPVPAAAPGAAAEPLPGAAPPHSPSGTLTLSALMEVSYLYVPLHVMRILLTI